MNHCGTNLVTLAKFKIYYKTFSQALLQNGAVQLLRSGQCYPKLENMQNCKLQHNNTTKIKYEFDLREKLH